MHHTKISYEETAGVEHTNQQSQKKTNGHNLLIKVTNWGKKEVYIYTYLTEMIIWLINRIPVTAHPSWWDRGEKRNTTQNVSI